MLRLHEEGLDVTVLRILYGQNYWNTFHLLEMKRELLCCSLYAFFNSFHSFGKSFSKILECFFGNFYPFVWTDVEHERSFVRREN